MQDYSRFISTPTDDQLAMLDLQIERFIEARARQDQQETDRLRFHKIPDSMRSMHVNKHVTNSGVHVRLEKSVKVSVQDGNRHELHNWLRREGFTDALAAVSCAFSTKQRRRQAESKVLAPLAMKLLEEGAPIPLELFGLSQTEKLKVCQAPGPIQG